MAKYKLRGGECLGVGVHIAQHLSKDGEFLMTMNQFEERELVIKALIDKVNSLRNKLDKINLVINPRYK